MTVGCAFLYLTLLLLYKSDFIGLDVCCVHRCISNSNIVLCYLDFCPFTDTPSVISITKRYLLSVLTILYCLAR